MLVLGCLVLPATAWADAETEITTGLVLGGGAVLHDDPDVQGADHDGTRGVFRFGVVGEVVFLRETNRDVGLGLYVELMTSSFRDVQPGGGLELLIPVHRWAPLKISAGAHYDYDDEHAGGFGGRLWWGAHVHNHFAIYNTTLGFWVEVRANVWGNRDILIAGGVEIDLTILTTPWMWFGSWVRGPSRQ